MDHGQWIGRAGVVVGLVAGLALGACSGGQWTGEQEQAGRAGAGPSDEPAGSGGVMPLARFLGWDRGATVDGGLSDQERQQERLVQELVARCMRVQGFEYVPENVEPEHTAGGPFALPPDEFAAQYGFGVTTIDAEDVARAEADPNQAIADALSPQAREVYRRALYGEAGARPLPGWVQPLPGAAQPEAEPPGHGGCYQEAQDELYGPPGTSPDGLAAAYAELEPELSALEDRVGRDPRVQAARGEWSGCMTDAGHPGFRTPDEPPQTIRDRLRALIGSAGRIDGRAPGVADPAQLQALRDLELALARADRACRAGHDQVVYEVRVDLQEQFIENHRDLLERYRDLASLAARGG
ncbi:MAG: hypothetical protein ACRD07_17755 [Acidimicrobiales bacterium]